MNNLRGLVRLQGRLTTCNGAAAPLNRLFCDYPRVNKVRDAWLVLVLHGQQVDSCIVALHLEFLFF